MKVIEPTTHYRTKAVLRCRVREFDGAVVAFERQPPQELAAIS